MLHGLLYWLGLTNAAGPVYSFWSGFGSDLGEVTLIAGVIALYRQHNCHVTGCWRIGKHPVMGTPYVTCAKHHPVIHGQDIKVEHVQLAHMNATKASKAKGVR